MQRNVFTDFSVLKEEKRKKMNSGACGGDGGNGGRDRDGKTPEQRHREFIQEMDHLRRREEV